MTRKEKHYALRMQILLAQFAWCEAIVPMRANAGSSTNQ
jgi:hypothetical protein